MKQINNNRNAEYVWSPDLGNGYYQNPIIHADYSDPDVIRAGSDFFMVASSFNMSPCLPVLHSTDLVNWKIINHVCDRFPFPRYDLPQHGDGVWAPSIRYHNDMYWVFFGAPDEGIFMSKTDNPFGKWSQLHLVKEAKGWIDPCPFWDEDGQAYLVNAFAKSRIGFKSLLQISKMKEDGTELMGEPTLVFDGNTAHPTIEGPKMYKRNGYYYIFAPAGGVAAGWQTVLRSKDILGPYEDKVVLAQGCTPINGPHQGAWVELESNESWFIHFQDKGAYGRITHLQPMVWKNDWPWIGTNQNELGVGEPVLQWRKPNAGHNGQPAVPQTNDEFNEQSLGLQWQWKANRQEKWYSLEDRAGWLRLYAVNQSTDSPAIYNLPNIITQKFPAEEFHVTVKVNFSPDKEGDRFGFFICGEAYAGILLKKSKQGYILSYVKGEQEEEEMVEEELLKIPIEKKERCFRIAVTKGADCRFGYGEAEHNMKWMSESFTAKPGKWIGAQVGLFCTSSEKSSGYADIEWIKFSGTDACRNGGASW